ncbi:MAG TPA: Na+/H+ antiporter, partial [Candidatus Aquilonibacter sp.]
FLIVLPPLLFAGGWNTDWYAFKRNLRPISLLSIGLVVLTTVVVAAIAHRLGGLDWPMSFVLGAIVSPPDAVAAEAVFERMAVPRRIVAVVTGEGLVNDGTALVLYRFALAAAVSGAFSLAHAPLQFVIDVVGGVAVGLIVALLGELVLRALLKLEVDDPTISNVVALIAPYAAYLPADAIGVSGVLAVVTAGIYTSRRSHLIFSPEARVISSAVWRVMLLLLNGLVFLAIGLTMPGIVGEIGSIGSFLWVAAVVFAAMIGLRIAWVYVFAWLPRLIPAIRAADPLPSWRWLIVIGWSGMRGIVSLAAALGLPYVDGHGHDLHGRAALIFITICAIVASLLLHGLTLGPLIAWLGISETHARQRQEGKIRIAALEEAVRYLHSIEPTLRTAAELEVAGRLRGEYERRIAHLRGHLDEGETQSDEQLQNQADHRISELMLDAERREIARQRAAGDIPDDIYRAILYDLDLAGLRLH